jgi:hypothetical protein
MALIAIRRRRIVRGAAEDPTSGAEDLTSDVDADNQQESQD